ncbi:hypothetical protein [Noviherbaspirillum saxi]|uniref:Phage tail assembly chaperone n=1 Tax=Noviherbaspirillum saxi TaxID=2320863 RepID=A0A3A3FT99_9BURK|nr:hypothetical protein [Noviherbaspirillum saxi]RJF99013.1 hypothetical protein D3871_11210 [Noviherbaspirillum saxi]
MAFKLAQTPTYKQKIIVEIPNENGRKDKSDFMAEYLRVDMDDIEELKRLPQKEVLERVLVGWSSLLDETGNDVPFNPVNRVALLKIPQAFEALVEGFWTSIFKAKEKN